MAILALLGKCFGDMDPLKENGQLVISEDGNVTQLHKRGGKFENESSEGLKEQVKTTFCIIQNVLKPIPLIFPS